MKRLPALLLAVMLPGTVVFGQSLAELAESAKKKRKKSTPVYTDEDLKKHAPAPSASPSPGARGPGSPAAASSEGGGGEGSSGGGEGGEGEGGGSRAAGDESSWREQYSTHVEAIKQAEQSISAAQSRLAALNADVSPDNLGDPFRLQTLEADKAKARQELEEGELALKAARDELKAFEEDARRRRIPPGWLREP